jgi:hypothetical protein
MVAFLQALDANIHLFNACQLDMAFREAVFELVPASSDSIKRSAFRFIARLINAQYRLSLRKEISEQIIERFTVDATMNQRCQFVVFCAEAFPILDQLTFTSYFLAPLTLIISEEKTPKVLKTVLSNLAFIWEHVLKFSSD